LAGYLVDPCNAVTPQCLVGSKRGHLFNGSIDWNEGADLIGLNFKQSSILEVMDYAVDIRLALEFKTSGYISITRGKPSVLNEVLYEVQHFHLALGHSRFAPYNPLDFLLIAWLRRWI